MLMQTDPPPWPRSVTPWPRRTPSNPVVAPINSSRDSEQFVIEFDSPAIAVGCGDASEAITA